MGEGIGQTLPRRDEVAVSEGLSVHGLGPEDWERAADRVHRYLAAMGVRDFAEVERLSAQVRLRLESRAASTPLEDPMEAAIEETISLLDHWLIDELGAESDVNILLAARAAVLAGTIPGWSARWAGLSDRSLAEAIGALCVSPLPEPAPLAMEPSTIELCCHRLGCRVSGAISRIFCRHQQRGGQAAHQ